MRVLWPFQNWKPQSCAMKSKQIDWRVIYKHWVFLQCGSQSSTMFWKVISTKKTKFMANKKSNPIMNTGIFYSTPIRDESPHRRFDSHVILRDIDSKSGFQCTIKLLEIKYCSFKAKACKGVHATVGLFKELFSTGTKMSWDAMLSPLTRTTH